MKSRVQLHEKFQPLFEPATPEHGRYKVFFGGRGSMKSWQVARSLLIRGVNKKRKVKLAPGENKDAPISFRVWCAREIQNSIEESVHHLLESQIKTMGIGGYYDVQRTKIVGRKGTGAEGTEFLFYGLHFNIEERKSMEDVDVVWIEEANKVSKYSWETIIPTIRKEYDDGTCSEIIVTFNPELAEDEAYKRFVNIKYRPSNATVVEVSWRDNPWFPTVLRVEMETLKKNDPDEYMVVYEGQTRLALQGAVFAKELRAAKLYKRICSFNVERGIPVSTYWDLGHSDYTAIWFIQRVGLQWRVIDFYQNRLEHIDHYIQVLQSRNYVYKTHWLPHDAKAKQLGSKMTIEEQLRGSDPDTREAMRDVRVLPVQRVADQHNALRSLFPNMYFEESATSEGVGMLARYTYMINPKTKQFSDQPLHDDASHAASALMQFAIATREPERRKGGRPKPFGAPGVPDHPQGWLSQ